jgi:hypothetical protein
MSLFTTEEKRRVNDYHPGLGDREPGLGSDGLLGLIADRLGSTDEGYGASAIGVEDAAGHFTGTDLETVLAELFTLGGGTGFTDTNNFYATDEMGPAFVALGVALGGTNSTTRNWTNGTGTRLTDNDSFYTAVNKLDQGFVDLLAVTTGDGAALVGIEDAAAWYAALTVEDALAELATIIGSTTSTTYNFTNGAGTRLTDNDAAYAALNKLDQGFVDLLAATNAKGASLVGVEDAGAYYAGVTVEAALAELGAGRDLHVKATIAVANTGGGGTDAAMTVDLFKHDGTTVLGSIRQVMIVATDTQYEPFVALEASVTFGTATKGSIVASGGGWCLAESDADGEFDCTVTNSADETVYFTVIAPPNGVSDKAKGVYGVISNSDAAAWSA